MGLLLMKKNHTIFYFFLFFFIFFLFFILFFYFLTIFDNPEKMKVIIVYTVSNNRKAGIYQHRQDAELWGIYLERWQRGTEKKSTSKKRTILSLNNSNLFFDVPNHAKVISATRLIFLEAPMTSCCSSNWCFLAK